MFEDEEVDIYRRISAEAVGGLRFAGTLVATSYDPKAHAVKGMLMPHGIETGWVPIAATHTGSGAGIFFGPKVGDAQKLDGDQFNVSFNAGDPNTLVAQHRMSQPDKPPQVQSGEMMIPLNTGSAKIYYDKDGNLNVNGAAEGQQVVLDKDGGATITDKDGGIVYLSEGKVRLGDKNASARVMTESGPALNVFAKV